MTDFRFSIWADDQCLAEAEVVTRIRVPDGWRELPRTERDEDLLRWLNEAAAVWLEGCYEEHPLPEEPGPEQGTML